MFISATPDVANSYIKNISGLLYLLEADNPYGPFDFVGLSGQNSATS